MNAEVTGWQLLAGWMIIIVVVGGTVALLQRSHRRSALPRPRPEHSAGAEDADRRRLCADLATIATPASTNLPEVESNPDESITIATDTPLAAQSDPLGEDPRDNSEPAAELSGTPTGTKVPECLTIH